MGIDPKVFSQHLNQTQTNDNKHDYNHPKTSREKPPNMKPLALNQIVKQVDENLTPSS
jgi:hypothetical protein